MENPDFERGLALGVCLILGHNDLAKNIITFGVGDANRHKETITANCIQLADLCASHSIKIAIKPVSNTDVIIGGRTCTRASMYGSAVSGFRRIINHVKSPPSLTWCVDPASALHVAGEFMKLECATTEPAEPVPAAESTESAESAPTAEDMEFVQSVQELSAAMREAEAEADAAAFDE